MPLRVRRAEQPAVRLGLGAREDDRAGRAGPLERRVHVVDVDQGPVDDVRHARPPRGRRALQRVVMRALVVRPRPAEHDDRSAELHDRLRDAAVVLRVALALDEAERPREPVDGGGDALVGEQGNAALHEVPKARLTPAAVRLRPPAISPPLYAKIATTALVLLIAIVFSGAAVRLTGSGLGCPDWPDCHGKVLQTELTSHGAIEYGNRLVTGLVAIAAIIASLAAFLRRPFRRDLAILGALLPLGVIGQAVLGGMAVLYGLAPGWVMGHFLLSMAILAGAVALAWRARSSDNAQERPTNPRHVVLATRALVPLGAWVLFLGTVTTASGPHPGSS